MAYAEGEMSVTIPATDPRLAFFGPEPVDPTTDGVRLQRFPTSASAVLRNQLGPLANLRSSSGCAVALRTDSPTVELHLTHLRHHQLVPQGVACEVEQPDGSWLAFNSLDLREQAGEVRVPFATGMGAGEAPRTVLLWLPLISTCVVQAVRIESGRQLEPVVLPDARWLAIGDSLTQGFSVQSPVQHWVHRLQRRWGLTAWNLGVGGVKIEPDLFEWALRRKRWSLVTIGLGSNHSWSEAEVERVPERAARMAEMALEGGHNRVVWLLPPYKPCEDGKGPEEFAGVPLNRETGERVRRVRETLRSTLAGFEPALQVVGDLTPRDPRYYPDGLHPFAAGFASYAENLDRALRHG